MSRDGARRPGVWVVEMQGRRDWHPVASDPSKRAADQHRRRYRLRNPDDSFRVVRYVRGELVTP